MLQFVPFVLLILMGGRLAGPTAGDGAWLNSPEALRIMAMGGDPESQLRKQSSGWVLRVAAMLAASQPKPETQLPEQTGSRQGPKIAKVVPTTLPEGHQTPGRTRDGPVC